MTASAVPPSARTSCTTVSRASVLRAASTTAPPSAAKSRAAAAPMPRLAPVMKMILPASRPTGALSVVFVLFVMAAASIGTRPWGAAGLSDCRREIRRNPPGSIATRGRTGTTRERTSAWGTARGPDLLVRRGQTPGVRRVGLYAGFCHPVASRRPGRRPSIWDRRCRRPRAVYPRTRAGHPQTSAQGRCRAAPLDLAPGGVYLAAWVTPDAGGLLHHRFTLTGVVGTAPAVCFLWHCPAGRPGWLLATTLPCGVRTFLGNPGFPRPSARLVCRRVHGTAPTGARRAAAARPAEPARARRRGRAFPRKGARRGAAQARRYPRHAWRTPQTGTSPALSYCMTCNDLCRYRHCEGRMLP